MSGSSQSQQLLSEATALYHSGDYRQAIQVWQELLEQDPDNQRAKEGIRMASLLLEEAQTSADSDSPAGSPESSETPEVIARVREGIQKVRRSLSASRYLDAMEICQSLLQLAPRSEAVREVLEEAREAYEAQPFIDEHLEIARQLFIQERLDEASAEIQKVFFLNPNHAEAKKLDAKIEALRQRQAPAAGSPSVPAPVTEVPSVGGVEIQRVSLPPDFGDCIDLPSEPEAQAKSEGLAPETAVPGAGSAGKGEEPVLNEDWEAELAQLSLGPMAPPEEVPVETSAPDPEPAPMLLTNLSEDPVPATAGEAVAAPSHPESDSEIVKPIPDLDLAGLDDDLLKETPLVAPAHADEEPNAVRWQELKERPKPSRAGPAVSRSGLPLGKIGLGLMVLLLLAGGGWWILGQRSASASGHGGGAGAPPSGRVPERSRPEGPGAAGGQSQVGLSSTGSRPGNAAATTGAGLALPGPTAAEAEPRTPEDLQKEIAGLFATGRAQLGRNSYPAAVETFSKILDLDPANIEAKANLDEAAGKVLDQKQLEEDLQTAKEYFLEKDYESALRKFYRLPKDRNLGEMDLFIRNAWYNWAVNSLRGGNCVEALQRLGEVLNLDPEDPEAAKQKEVAEHYRDRPKDRVFYAYVDRLTYRTLNQK